MMQLPNPQRGNINSDTCSEQLASLLLLDGRQWLFVQNTYNLTPREREIAELICQGLRNGSIARNLCIKPGTVKTHTRNIYRKVRVKSRMAMLLKFVSDTREISVS
jgi:DNA-binding CsgD family transcriptional regulator